MLHRVPALVLTLAIACSDPAPGATTAAPDAASTTDAAKLPGDTSATPDTTTTDVSSDAGGNCTTGESGCFTDTVSKVCIDGLWSIKQKCTGDAFCLEGACATAGTCTAGAIVQCDGVTTQIVCSSKGKALIPVKCTGQQLCADGKCRDVACIPKSPECTGKNTFHVCKDDGSGWSVDTDCKSGAVCLGGTCLSLCETTLKIASNVGCEYWSVDLDNDPSMPPIGGNPDGLTPEMVPHSVVISNPGIYEAKLTFTVQSGCADGAVCAPTQTTCSAKKTVCGTPTKAYDLAFADNTVAPGASREFKMPVMNVDGSGITRKAIHVKSSQPVVAFQFNPFNAEGAASNDGSLLLPQNTLGKLYFGVALSSVPYISAFPNSSQHGYVTIVAASPGMTTVQVTPTTAVTANPKLGVPQDGSKPPTLAAGKTYTFQLQPYDVLSLQSEGQLTPGGAKDLTGTRIEADKPIAVFGGHENTGIGDELKKGDENYDTCCTEHLEEQLLPVETWGTEAFCLKSKPRGYDRDLWIVVAGADNVALTTVPAVKGLDGKLLVKAGDSLRIQTDESFQVQGTGKIQVVQFLMSGGQTQDKTGDPSMLVVPPRKQYRKDYLVRTADGFGTNWLTIARPKGLDVKLDGKVLVGSEFDAFGDGTWEFGWFKVAKGTHVVEAELPIGLMVYGYGNVTAYGYPGGMNLE